MTYQRINYDTPGFLRSRCQGMNNDDFTRMCSPFAPEINYGTPVRSHNTVAVDVEWKTKLRSQAWPWPRAPSQKSVRLARSPRIPSVRLISHVYRSAIRPTSDGSSQDTANNLDLATRVVFPMIAHHDGRSLRYAEPPLQID